MSSSIVENKEQAPTQSLRKVLSLLDLVFLGISCTIGAGPYSIIGIASSKSGPGIIFVYSATGIMCLFTGFAYAEFAAKIPTAGFSYNYAYYTFGKHFAAIVGISLTFCSILTVALLARCWAAYCVGFLNLLHLNVSQSLSSFQFGHISVSVLGCLIILVLFILMLNGVKSSAFISGICFVLNVGTLVLSIFAGIFFTDSSRYEPAFPFGLNGMLDAAGLAFYTYLGFESLTCFTEESVNPQKHIPLALVASITLTICVYVGIAAVMVGMAPLGDMNKNDSLLAVFNFHGASWMGFFISVGSIAATTTCIVTSSLCPARVFYAMAKDGIFPAIFARVNPKTDALDFGLAFSTALSGLLTLTVDVESLGKAIALDNLFISIVIDVAVVIERYKDVSSGKTETGIKGACVGYCVAAFYLGVCINCELSAWHYIASLAIQLALCFYIWYNYSQTNVPRTFACPMVPFLPLISATSYLFVCSTIDILAWIMYLSYLAVGMVVYGLLVHANIFEAIKPSPKAIIGSVDEGRTTSANADLAIPLQEMSK